MVVDDEESRKNPLFSTGAAVYSHGGKIFSAKTDYDWSGEGGRCLEAERVDF